MIFEKIDELKTYLDSLKAKVTYGYSGIDVIATSGGFDPLHVGHVRCIRASKRIVHGKSILVVIVNGDGFLERKKGYNFMSLQERMEIIDAIKEVDYVTAWDDGSQTVIGAIKKLKPNYFTKGGDRTSESNVPESDICNKIECKVIFNVGGEKIQSSSYLVNKNKNVK